MKYKLAVIGHHIVVEQYQELWEVAAHENPNIEITLIYPNEYLQNGKVQFGNTLDRFSQRDTSLIKRVQLDTFWGKEGRQHFFTFQGLNKELQKINPDYVYAIEEANSLVTYQISQICKKLNVRYSFWSSLNVNRNYWEMYPWYNIRKYLFSFCQKKVFNSCDLAHFTTVAAQEVAMLQGYKGESFVSQTHGVNQIFFDQFSRRQTKSNTKISIGYAGRFWHWKGLDILIEAIAKLPNSKSYELVMYGDGEEKENLILQAKNLNVDVRWEDSVGYELMPEVFSKIDIFVLPSLTRGGINEKFGRVLIEAMATGCAVIGSADGGIPKVIGEAGLLFTPGDSNDLNSKLVQLLDSKDELTGFQEKAYIHAKRNHSYSFVSSVMFEKFLDKIQFD